MFYAPWDSDSIRARSEIEIVANHYGQQIFFAAINCWWPDGECRKYHNLRRYPHFVALIRSEGEIEYKGPILASYIIPFLDNVMNPLIPVQNEGELLDLRAQHDVSGIIYNLIMIMIMTTVKNQSFLFTIKHRLLYWVILILINHQVVVAKFQVVIVPI